MQGLDIHTTLNKERILISQAASNLKYGQYSSLSDTQFRYFIPFWSEVIVQISNEKCSWMGGIHCEIVNHGDYRCRVVDFYRSDS